MRIILPCVLLLFEISATSAADEVVLTDGQVIVAPVEAVKVKGKESLPRARVLSVRLSDDRALIDAAWIEELLRFALQRERDDVPSNGKVGVYLGRGVSAPSAIAAVRRLDQLKRKPRLLFEGDVTKEGLRGLDTLVVPGGWAPSQLASLGPGGQAAIRSFVESGGNFFGICAGGYLVCTQVRWAGIDYPYPLGLVRGTATGPVAGLAPWPSSGVVKLTTEDKKEMLALYAGGSSFDVTGARVLATYPDGQAAAVRVDAGKGHVLVTGAHVEFDQRTDKDLLDYAKWASGLQPGTGGLFKQFLRSLERRK